MKDSIIDRLAEVCGEQRRRIEVTLAVFAEITEAYGWKEVESESDFLSYSIYYAKRDAMRIMTTNRPVIIGKASYDVAAMFTSIYKMTMAGIVPTPAAEIRNGQTINEWGL